MGDHKAAKPKSKRFGWEHRDGESRTTVAGEAGFAAL
jgi:pyocin large subunit-like protein